MSDLKAYKVVGYLADTDEGFSVNNPRVIYDVTQGSVWKSSSGIPMSSSAKHAKAQVSGENLMMLVFDVMTENVASGAGGWASGKNVRVFKASLNKRIKL